MKKSGKDRLKLTIYESTLSTADAVPLPQWGRLRYENAAIPETQPGRQRGGGFAAKKEANPASLRSAAPSKGRGSRGYSLLPTEGGAPKGRRLDGGSGISASKPSPRGEGWRYEGNLPPANLRASPRFVILSGEKRRMRDNECQNSCDLSHRSRRSRHHNPEPQNLVKQNPLTRAFSSCIITSVVVMNYVY